MKLLLSLAMGLLGLGLFLTSGSTPAALATSEVAAITTGADSDGDIDPVPLYRICTANAANCTDCFGGTKCSKNQALRLCKPTEKVSKCTLSVKTDCGKATIYEKLDCTGLSTAGGACTELTCP